MTSKIKAYDVNGIQINVGDPVMCVGDVYRLTVGKTYTVESISENGEFVRVVGDNGRVDGWGGRNFRIDKSEIDLDASKFKAGDEVRVVGLELTWETHGRGYPMLSVGDEAVVEVVVDGACVIDDFYYHPDDLELVKDEPIKAAGEAVRSIESKFFTRGGLAADIRDAFPEAFGDLVTATWDPCDPDASPSELLRVAEMEGAHVTATRYGATRSGNVHHVERSVRIHLGIISDEVVIDLLLGGWTITATAPKPADPTGGDPVVLAADASTKKRVLFRAEDGNWSTFRGSAEGVWMTDDLSVIERLKPETIAELMGGEQA